MKIKELRQIIREEIKSVLSENQPAPAKKPREAPDREVAEPGTKPGKEEKRRKLGNPNVKPAPKAKTKATLKEADMISKITQRFKKLKKKPLGEIKVKDPMLLGKVKNAIEDYVKAENSVKGKWNITGPHVDPEVKKAEEIKIKAMKIIKDSDIPKEQIQQEFSEIRKKLKKLKKK
jgi:hypothetical protein